MGIFPKQNTTTVLFITIRVYNTVYIILYTCQEERIILLRQRALNQTLLARAVPVLFTMKKIKFGNTHLWIIAHKTSPL
jgi:hypothetical protein